MQKSIDRIIDPFVKDSELYHTNKILYTCINTRTWYIISRKKVIRLDLT
jgi:hypothetical protein